MAANKKTGAARRIAKAKEVIQNPGLDYGSIALLAAALCAEPLDMLTETDANIGIATNEILRMAYEFELWLTGATDTTDEDEADSSDV